MKLNIVLAALLGSAALLAQAQTTAPSRADVKAETAKANKAGEIQTGEEEPKWVDTKSNVKRADVKADTAKANKAGTIPPMGEK